MDEHKSCCSVSRSSVELEDVAESGAGADGQAPRPTLEEVGTDGQSPRPIPGEKAEARRASSCSDKDEETGADGQAPSSAPEEVGAVRQDPCPAPEEVGPVGQAPSSDKDAEAETVGQSQSPTMVRIPGGKFLMGTNVGDGFPEDGEAPIHNVRVRPFKMAPYTVTNAQFSDFIQATGYVTDAEKYGWSFVFHLLVSEATKQSVTQKVQHTPWWWVVEGATWDHPEGPDSDISARLDHPVVHVSWNDADAYCAWRGVRLPTEAEWECAARGGLEQKRYPWGNELTPDGAHQCNIWQGDFPQTNTEEDGYLATAPAVSFPANGYGLYNVAGNVWEWCSDWFATNIHQRGGKDNPAGPQEGESRVMRGGSYLCHHSYCNRYRVGARSANTPDSSTGNMGFRVAMDV